MKFRLSFDFAFLFVQCFSFMDTRQTLDIFSGLIFLMLWDIYEICRDPLGYENNDVEMNAP